MLLRSNCGLLLVTHGLTLRIFLMRWFHWSVEDFLQVYNPNNGDVRSRVGPKHSGKRQLCPAWYTLAKGRPRLSTGLMICLLR